jgi:hypothetical protein
MQKAAIEAATNRESEVLLEVLGEYKSNTRFFYSMGRSRQVCMCRRWLQGACPWLLYILATSTNTSWHALIDEYRREHITRPPHTHTG